MGRSGNKSSNKFSKINYPNQTTVMMKSKTPFLVTLLIAIVCISCETANKKEVAAYEELEAIAAAEEEQYYGGFASQLEWGEHLVLITDCNECHTPKKMTDKGPVLDTSLMLSGHPADRPGIEINRKELEEKGIGASRESTEWVGPWGISYAGNLTPDETGIGNWTEEQFFTAIRKGKYKGLEGSRNLLPPMPWTSYRNLTDDELRAIFSYLKSIKPISNLVPAAVPPVSSQ